MPEPPADKSIHFERSQLPNPPKNSSSPFLKVLLAFVGTGFLVHVPGLRKFIEEAKSQLAEYQD